MLTHTYTHTHTHTYTHTRFLKYEKGSLHYTSYNESILERIGKQENFTKQKTIIRMYTRHNIDNFNDVLGKKYTSYGIAKLLDDTEF